MSMKKNVVTISTLSVLGLQLGGHWFETIPSYCTI